MQIHFMGADRNVTGSRHLFTVNGKNFLLDCGMYQDRASIKADRNREFGFDAASVDFVILSHAHIDHSGCLPLLVKQGFRGIIFSTPATADLCTVMLTDSAHIQEHDTEYNNKRRIAEGKAPREPIYNQQDVDETMKLFRTVPYDEKFTAAEGIQFLFTDAGHILGSAAINLILQENGKTVHVTFSGDIGRRHDLILRSPQPFPQADYILCESTYGDRLHDEQENAAQKLCDTVRHTCIEKKGKLLIPAFSLGRTQEIVYTLDRMHAQGKLPKIKVFVDSPLSTNATNIMRRHPESFNADVLRTMKTDPDPFGFAGLEYVRDVEQSKSLNTLHEPCIIIAASGMLEAGRIRHHVRNNIEDKRNTILLVGYCPPDTLGGALLAGKKEVHIFGQTYKVKAEIVAMHSYSAHGDYKEILEFLSCQNPHKVKKLFLVHGEYDVQKHFQKTLYQTGFTHVVIPQLGQKEEL